MENKWLNLAAKMVNFFKITNWKKPEKKLNKILLVKLFVAQMSMFLVENLINQSWSACNQI